MNEHPLLWRGCKAIACLLTRLLFDLKVYGIENIPDDGPILLVSNHQSLLDPVLLGAGLNRPLSYIAKSELFEISPAITWLFRSLGGFPVQQARQRGGDIGAIRQCLQRLEQGHILNIFPEGSRTPDGEIGRLEKGVALIERRARVPIVPAVIVGAYEAWPIHQRFLRPWPVRVRFGSPMELADLPPDQILLTLDRTLRRMFSDLRADACPKPVTVPHESTDTLGDRVAAFWHRMHNR